LSSASRARAFLWLVFHYYQGPRATNPFADEYAEKNPGQMPRIQRLTEDEMNRENVDLTEEVEWAGRKSAQRSIILRDLIETEELEKRAKGKATLFPSGPKGLFNCKLQGFINIVSGAVEYAPPRSQRTPPQREDNEKLRENFRYYLPGEQICPTAGPLNGMNYSAPAPPNHHQSYPSRRPSQLLANPARRGKQYCHLIFI
jgi:hypothetical protein